MIAGDWWWIRLAYFDGCPLIQNHPEYVRGQKNIKRAKSNIKVKVNTSSIGLITITKDRDLNTDPCTK